MISPTLVHKVKKGKVSPGRNAGRILVKNLGITEIDLTDPNIYDAIRRPLRAGRNAGGIVDEKSLSIPGRNAGGILVLFKLTVSNGSRQRDFVRQF